ncbi:hypothetical protein SAMN04488514_10393 [Kriegella aquimaris]|uniref:Secreted protein n=1 Tax=Kriegella aquimaris TaxID=192904 RepID=A0A1G9N9Y1_9FLAO|nr:hypothetical protein SAMN04488514_10393 [Kriegella aquimaris]
MKVSKLVLFALVSVFTMGLTSCVDSTAQDDQLYEDAIRKDEIKDQDVD